MGVGLELYDSTEVKRLSFAVSVFPLIKKREEKLMAGTLVLCVA